MKTLLGSFLVVVLVTGGSASSVLAQPGMTASPPAPPTTIVKPTTTDQGIVDDVNAGRAWLTPTALIQPKGTTTFSNYEILGFGFTYAATDSIQFSVQALLPVDEGAGVAWFTAKAQLLRSGSFRLAAHGAIFAGEDEAIGLFGLAGTMCIDQACNSTLNGYAGQFFGSTIDADEKVMLLALSWTQQFAKGVKLVLEMDEMRQQRSYNAYPRRDQLIWYGIRFTSNKAALEVGLVRPLDDFDDDFPLGLPWINFTYRGGM